MKMILKLALFFIISFVVILTVMTLVLGTLQPDPKNPNENQKIEANIDSVRNHPGASDTVVIRDDRQLDSLKTLLVEMEKENNQLEKDLKSVLAKKKADEEKKKNKLSEALQENAKQMAKIYENMAPEEAAAILTALDPGLAVEIISSMKKRQAAKIMAAMNPDTAVVLSKKLASLP